MHGHGAQGGCKPGTRALGFKQCTGMGHKAAASPEPGPWVSSNAGHLSPPSPDTRGRSTCCQGAEHEGDMAGGPAVIARAGQSAMASAPAVRAFSRMWPSVSAGNPAPLAIGNPAPLDMKEECSGQSQGALKNLGSTRPAPTMTAPRHLRHAASAAMSVRASAAVGLLVDISARLCHRRPACSHQRTPLPP
jgi:hypothetical protein